MDPISQQEALVRTFGAVNAYSEDDGLFFISPDRIGFGYLCEPISGIDQPMFDALNGLLNLAYPAGVMLQFTLYASPDIEDTIFRYKTMRQNVTNPLLKEISNQRVEFMRSLTRRQIGKVSGAKLRQVRIFISVSIPHGVKPPTRDEMMEYRELRQTFSASLRGCGFSTAETVTPESYVRFMETVLNHSPSAMWRRTPWGFHDRSTLLCNQLLDHDTQIDISDKDLRLGESAVVRTLSVKRYPDYVHPGMALRYMADLMKGTKAAREPMLITANIYYPDHESERSSLTRKYAWTQRQAEGPLSKLIPDWVLQSQSQRIVLDRVGEGDRIIEAFIGAAVIAEDDDKVTQASQEMQSMFRELGIQMMEDRFVLAPMFSQLLPFAVDADIRPALMRYRQMATKQVIPLLPIMGSWSGTGTPLLTLFGRDGNLMRISPNDTDGNMNVVIAAQSGMGKSFLSNEVITNYLSIGGRTWIIDKGYSYKKLCEVMGGTYIEFTEDLDMCLNPFGMVKSFEEEGDILASLLEIMATPKEGLDSYRTAGLKRILKKVWDTKGNNACVDDIARELAAEPDSRLRDVGSQMHAFTSEGVYGRWFNGPNTCNMDNSLIVLELQQLSGRKDLQRVVLLQLMYQIQMQMDALPRDMPKALLIDEAFGLLASNETKDFIITFYRQLRKFGASCMVATQSINDFYGSAGAEAIVENSGHMWLLGQKPESIAIVKREGRLPMPDAAFKLLESIHTVQGEYSEVLVRNAFGIGAGRLVVSEFNKLLYSSKAQDVMAIRALTDRGHGLSDAIRILINERESGSATEVKVA